MDPFPSYLPLNLPFICISLGKHKEEQEDEEIDEDGCEGKAICMNIWPPYPHLGSFYSLRKYRFRGRGREGKDVDGVKRKRLTPLSLCYPSLSSFTLVLFSLHVYKGMQREQTGIEGNDQPCIPLSNPSLSSLSFIPHLHQLSLTSPHPAATLDSWAWR